MQMHSWGLLLPLTEELTKPHSLPCLCSSQ
jgi:hypothetical protein